MFRNKDYCFVKPMAESWMTQPIDIDQDTRSYPFGVDGWTWEMWDTVRNNHKDVCHELWLQVNGTMVFHDANFPHPDMITGLQFRLARLDSTDPLEPLCHLHDPFKAMSKTMKDACQVHQLLEHGTSMVEIHVQIDRPDPNWRAIEAIENQFLGLAPHLLYKKDKSWLIQDQDLDQLRALVADFNKLYKSARVILLVCKVI
jgi:hypothetical protein